jgi:hypothetical protein
MEQKMKTRFKHNIEGLTGKLDGLVYYYHPVLNEILARKFNPSANNPSAERLAAIMANLKLLSPSNCYKQDIRDYLVLYNRLIINRDKKVCNWSNLHLKMLYTMVRINPEINLAELTRQQIYEQDLPCKNIKAAIEAGLLPWVKDYTMFTNDI